MCPVGLDHREGIILGTHHEKGAFTFWSYAIGLPLPSSAILSWKFCHVLHKVLRDGHPNVSVPSEMSLPHRHWGEFLALTNVPLCRGQVLFPAPAAFLRPWGGEALRYVDLMILEVFFNLEFYVSMILSCVFKMSLCKAPTSGCH